MRLIDADKFMEELKDDTNNMETIEFIICTQAITHDFAKQPTIEAISIEWIKEWGNEFYESINDRVFYNGDGRDTIWDLLEAWEKKNE